MLGTRLDAMKFDVATIDTHGWVWEDCISYFISTGTERRMKNNTVINRDSAGMYVCSDEVLKNKNIFVEKKSSVK